MKKHFLITALLFTALSFVVVAKGRSEEVTTKKQPSRNLASVDDSGQGEKMLRQLTNPSPGFLSPAANHSRVHMGGICRDNFSHYYTSDDKGYSDCLSTPLNVGPGQRAAGAGVLVGL